MQKTSFLVVCCLLICGCDIPSGDNYVPKSNAGVAQTKADIPINENGRTVEQENILKRYKIDNTVGSIKHLYVISPVSGQVLIYSTVDGKVTSSGKRLTPKTVAAIDGEFIGSQHYGMATKINNEWHRSSEVIQDDGTYGDSIDYLYWYDTKGNYHQQYVEGCIVHISDQPLPIKNIVLNLEVASQPEKEVDNE